MTNIGISGGWGRRLKARRDTSLLSVRISPAVLLRSCTCSSQASVRAWFCLMVRARDPTISQPGFFTSLEGLRHACRAQDPSEQLRGSLYPWERWQGYQDLFATGSRPKRGIGAGEGWKGFLNLPVGMGREWSRLVWALLDCLPLYRTLTAAHFCCESPWASEVALPRAFWRVGHAGGQWPRAEPQASVLLCPGVPD